MILALATSATTIDFSPVLTPLLQLAGLVLTGGSSNLSGIETLGCDVLKLPVRVGCPLHITGITDSLRDLAYATGVGLLLWGAKHPAGRSQEWNGGGFTSRMRGLAGRLASLFSGK